MLKKGLYIILLFFLLFNSSLTADNKNNKRFSKKNKINTPFLDWKMQEAGNLKLMITNYGMIGGDNDFFTHSENFIKCEYPINSNIEHFEGGGIWLGAIIDTSSNPAVKKEIKKVSTGYEGWGGDGYSTGGGGLLNEMFPSSKSSDSILIINKYSKKPDYWDSYYGNMNFYPISDVDFICQYTDTILPYPDPMHVPLGLKVIQRTLSWKTSYFDEVIIIKYQIINLKLKPIRDVYVGFFMDMDVGPIKIQKEKFNASRNFWEDNYTGFIDSLFLAYVDNPIDKPSTPLAFSIIDCNYSIKNLKKSFTWYISEESPDPDSKRYDYLSSGQIKPNQSVNQCNDTRFLLGIGPFNFEKNDTIEIITAIIAGENIEKIIKNHKKSIQIYKDNYFVPSPPPSPELKISTVSRGVKINWSSSGIKDPENFIDFTNNTAKLLYDGKVFEGYRIYKAEGSNPSKKDFILLSEYDKPGNLWGFNTGLKYEIIDTNVISGRTYTYSVTSFTIEDTSQNHYRESLESSILDNAVSIQIPYSVKKNKQVIVIPNPYIGDGRYNGSNNWEGDISTWTENNRLIRFINLPEKCIIRIFTVAGELIKTIQHNNSFNNWEDWNLQTSSGRIISSGIYIFNIESPELNQTGKFVVIK